MKTNQLITLQLPALAAGFLLSFIGPALSAPAQKAEPTEDSAKPKEEEITATGTVFSVEPELLSVVMKDNPTPVRFSYSKDTPFLDEKGGAVPLDLVRAELPLTVHYAMEGEKMVARRIVVSRSMVAGDAGEKPSRKRTELAEEKAEESTRAAEAGQTGPQELVGTLSNIEQTVSIMVRGETTPTSCIVNNSTRYVNVSGQPVSTSLLMSGMPISVKVVRDGKRLMAQEIMVRGNPTTLSGSRNNQQTGSRSAQNGPSQGSNGTNSSGNIGGYSDLSPIQGYVIPNQGFPGSPGDAIPSPNNGNSNQNGNTNQTGNANQSGNPNQTVNPNAPNQNPNSPNQSTNAGQTNANQPNPAQPNVAPAGGTQNPARNTNNNNGTNRNNNGGTQPAQSGSGNNSGNQSGSNNSGGGSTGGSGSNNSGGGTSGNSGTSGGTTSAGGGAGQRK